MYRPLEIALRSTTAAPPFAVQPPAQAVAQEYLPFTVRVVDTEAALHKAVQIRHAAYARHIAPHLALALQAPEALDRVPGAVVLLAESKVDGSPLGTMRIQTNRHGPLTLEQSVE